MIDLTKPENWDAPLFPLVVAAKAALVAPATLRQWIVRYGDDLRLWQNEAASGRAEAAGFAHRFSLRDTLHIAAAARLIAKGVSVRDAYLAALTWAHIGAFDRPAGYADEPAPVPSRLPAGLFAEPAWTFLVHYQGSHAKVVGVKLDGSDLPFQFSDLFSEGYPVRTSPTIVFLNNLDSYVRGICEGYLRPDENAQ